ncbi:MAG: B12-binding domain-containing radical SAM protein [Proteobacteria bacterium]|nr:B12-binding domain-containing radical SAM protein [Pseudomonadota bacterium]
MNILFINMPIRVTAKPNVVPTGIGILSSLTKKLGHSCEVLDLNSIRPAVNIEQVKKKLSMYPGKFDMVCLSGMITTLRWQKRIATLVREIFPETCLISGGGLASDFNEILFSWIPELDATVQGEGEPILPLVFQDAHAIRGSKKIFGPEILKNMLDIPMVDWDAFDMETYLNNPIWGTGAGNASWTPFQNKRSVNLISSRGCPYNCNFCDRKATGGLNYRIYGVEQILSEVRTVVDRFSVDFIGFVDDNFLSNKARLVELLPEMEKIGVIWGCHGRLNEVDEDLARRLRRAGCVYIGFGGESADPYILKRMNKKNKPEQMSQAIKACQSFDITPNCTWIMGYPGETRASLRCTAKFILKHGLSQKNMFVATAYPGTNLFEEVKDKIFTVYGSLQEYVLDLDDATKFLSKDDKFLNYSDMSDDEFLECREYVERGALELI